MFVRKIFILLYFWKIFFFIGYSIFVGGFFFFFFFEFKAVTPLFLACIVSDTILAVCVFCLVNSVWFISLPAFKIF